MDTFELKDTRKLKLIGKKIKAIREEADLSQRKLGKETNYSKSSISAFETGERSPHLYAAFNLADALGCSIEDFRPEPDPFDY